MLATHIPRKRQRIVPRERIGHPRIRQHGRTAGEELDQDDPKPHDGAARATACIQKDLRGRQTGGRGEDAVEVFHAETEGDGEHPADETGDEHGHADGDGAADGGVEGFFRHAGGWDLVFFLRWKGLGGELTGSFRRSPSLSRRRRGICKALSVKGYSVRARRPD